MIRPKIIDSLFRTIPSEDVDFHPHSFADSHGRLFRFGAKRGVEQARGEYIAFIDAYNVRLAEKLERPVEILRSQPEAALVKEAGFDSACSTTNGLVGRRSNLFELPRYRVPDGEGQGLGDLLKQWFGAW
jgi:hypothetical protein